MSGDITTTDTLSNLNNIQPSSVASEQDLSHCWMAGGTNYSHQDTGLFTVMWINVHHAEISKDSSATDIWWLWSLYIR